MPGTSVDDAVAWSNVVPSHASALPLEPQTRQVPPLRAKVPPPKAETASTPATPDAAVGWDTLVPTGYPSAS